MQAYIKFIYPMDASTFCSTIHLRELRTPWAPWKFKVHLIPESEYEDAWNGGRSVLCLRRKTTPNGEWIPVPGLPYGLGTENHAVWAVDEEEDPVEVDDKNDASDNAESEAGEEEETAQEEQNE